MSTLKIKKRRLVEFPNNITDLETGLTFDEECDIERARLTQIIEFHLDMFRNVPPSGRLQKCTSTYPGWIRFDIVGSRGVQKKLSGELAGRFIGFFYGDGTYIPETLVPYDGIDAHSYKLVIVEDSVAAALRVLMSQKRATKVKAEQEAAAKEANNK